MRLSPLLLLPSLLLTEPRASSVRFAPPDGRAVPTPDGVTMSVRWNRLVPGLFDLNTARRRAARAAAAGDSAALRRIAMSPPPISFRVFTMLGVAQYVAASSAKERHVVSSDAAVATASAGVLSELFPDSAIRASITRELARDLERARTGARGAERADAGRRMGDDVARRVIAWAPSLDFAAASSGPIPKGPGMWFTAPGQSPSGIFLARSRPWIIDSASQFRPAPPPAFDSPAFASALDEVKRIARTRTPEQTRIAQRWNTGDPWAVWNEVATAAIIRHRLPDVDAARVFAMLSVAASDAVLACFEAKYHYWTIRPSQVDTTLALADSVDLPNFPSFPSGHACSAGAFDAALGHYLPQERAEFTRMAEEQAMSRLYGGIHYRFDNDGGLALGRTVARYVIERERNGAFAALRPK